MPTAANRRTAELLAALAGLILLAASFGQDRTAAGAAAGQVWPAFVLVAGLLLVGLVADRDGLFAAAGGRLARSADRSWFLFAGMAVLIVSVTAVLNLDTAVTFLTPVAVHTCRARRQDPAFLLAACLLLSNAGSLPLPGSNLTNVIVLGGLHLTGGAFLARMAVPWMVAVAVTTAAIAVVCRRSLAARITVREDPRPAHIGLGVLAVAASAVLVLAFRNPALAVLGVGVLVVSVRLARGRVALTDVRGVLGLPVLVFLFGLAVSGGSAGRQWGGLATAMGHLDPLATAAAAAAVTVLVNNLPAAALLSAHRAVHPFSLLIGLDIGPNLFVSGSLSWILWMGAARRAGVEAPLRRTMLIGVVSAPLALAGAVGALYVAGAVT